MPVDQSTHASPDRTQRSPRAVQRLIEGQFESLSPELQRAARWVTRHSPTLALHSMRHSARAAGVTPATMTRLAQRLGFDGFEEMREPFRQAMAQGDVEVKRVRPLPASEQGTAQALDQGIQSLNKMHTANVASVVALNDVQTLQAAAHTLVEAQQVHFLGLRVCHSVAFYMSYAYGLLFGNGHLVAGTGGTLSDQMAGIGSSGVLVVLSQAPYSRQTVEAVALARRHGAVVVALTDSPLSPLTTGARHVLLYDTRSNSQLHSGIGAQALAETLVATAAALGGQTVVQHMRRRQAHLRDSGAYWERPEDQE